jgi:hypothetical protein
MTTRSKSSTPALTSVKISSPAAARGAPAYRARNLPAKLAAAYLPVTLSDIMNAVDGLSVALESAGLRVHSGSTGLRIVANYFPVNDSGEAARTLQC